MHIRKAELPDAHAVATVHVGAWQAAYRGIVADDYLDSLSVMSRTEVWRKILSGEYARKSEEWLAEVDGGVVGWIGIGSCRDGDAPQTQGEVLAINILKDYWSVGIGQALMTKGLARLEEMGFASASLWVLKDNARARKFYEALGLRHATNSETVIEKELVIGGSKLIELRYELELTCAHPLSASTPL